MSELSDHQFKIQRYSVYWATGWLLSSSSFPPVLPVSTWSWSRFRAGFWWPCRELAACVLTSQRPSSHQRLSSLCDQIHIYIQLAAECKFTQKSPGVPVGWRGRRKMISQPHACPHMTLTRRSESFIARILSERIFKVTLWIFKYLWAVAG